MMKTQYRRVRDERDRLRAASSALVKKLDACKPHLDGLAVLNHVHGGQYDGPTYGEELEQLRSIVNRRTEGPVVGK